MHNFFGDGWSAVLFLLVAAVCVVGVYRWRVHVLRNLALRWNLSYRGKELPGKFPMDRRRFCFPANHFKKILHVVSGVCNGHKVLIVDVIAGTGKGIYVTIFAVESASNPFEEEPAPWRLVFSNGWFALWRTRFWQVPWTMNISQIEERLNRL
jgi:hypothetical protein